MAEFCSNKCKEIGSICDNCTRYRDELENEETGFAGMGICDVDGHKTMACYGQNCNDFKCFCVK